MRNLLIIGGCGYIGSMIVNKAVAEGYNVKVVDLLWFNKNIPLIHFNNPKYNFINGDIGNENILDTVLKDIDYVLYTAAVVGDPAGNKYPTLTQYTNVTVAKNVIAKCIEFGIKGFIYFSTCSNYGIAENRLANEESVLNPLSFYAKTKVEIENYLIEKSKNLNWIICRLSTVYGLSPRMRFDLTVNEFALKGVKEKYIDIFKPESYRPYIHTYDLANIVLEILKDFPILKNNIFNIGFNGENYPKIQIANIIKELIPSVKIDILNSGGDNRDYKVDFSKIHKFIKLNRHYDVKKAVKNIIRVLESGIIKYPLADEYYNTKLDIE